jgi:hypothetical protein
MTEFGGLTQAHEARAPGRTGRGKPAALIAGIAIAAASVGALLVVTGAGSPAQVRAVTEHGPTAKVSGIYERFGGPVSPGNYDPHAPIKGTITVTGGPRGLTVRVTANGRFTLQLPPGKYVLKGWTPTIHVVSASTVSAGSECGSETITLRAGQVLQTVLACDVP